MVITAGSSLEVNFTIIQHSSNRVDLVEEDMLQFRPLHLVQVVSGVGARKLCSKCHVCVPSAGDKMCVSRPGHDAGLPDLKIRGVDDFAEDEECVLGRRESKLKQRTRTSPGIEMRRTDVSVTSDVACEEKPVWTSISPLGMRCEFACLSEQT
jgi:hypothetical protein